MPRMPLVKNKLPKHSWSTWPALILYYCGCALLSCSHEKEKPFMPGSQQLFHEHNFYKHSESFVYSASYGLLQVGELHFECDSIIANVYSHPCYRLSASGHLKGVAGGLSYLEDRWESYVDTATLMPYVFSRDLKENKYRKKEFTVFKREEQLAVVTDTTEPDARRIKTFPITSDIEDMLSAYFLFRNTPFYKMNPGDTITINAFLEEASYNVKVKYLGKEKIRTKFGKLKAIVIAPLLSNAGMLSGEYPLKAWLSDDDRKIPLKVQVKITLGSVDLQLESYYSRKGKPGSSLQ